MNSSSNRPKLRHYLEWGLLRGVLRLLRQGDMEAAYRLVRRLSPLLRRVLRSEWGWANTNLKLIYGQNLSEQQRTRLACLAFENVLCSHVDGLRVSEISFEHKNIQHAHDAYGLGRGAVMVTVHLGSWELGLKGLSEAGLPTAVVYRHANNPLSEQLFKKARGPYGVTWIRRGDSRGAVRALQQKKLLVLMTDINQRRGGVVAPFLGLPAMCPEGPARLALRFGCPVVPAVVIRVGPGRVVALMGPPIEPPADPRDDGAVMALTVRINQAFEEWIHQFAEQYNWLHARWRTRPDGSLWRSDDCLDVLLRTRTVPHPPLSDRVRSLLA